MAIHWALRLGGAVITQSLNPEHRSAGLRAHTVPLEPMHMVGSSAPVLQACTPALAICKSTSLTAVLCCVCRHTSIWLLRSFTASATTVVSLEMSLRGLRAMEAPMNLIIPTFRPPVSTSRTSNAPGRMTGIRNTSPFSLHLRGLPLPNRLGSLLHAVVTQCILSCTAYVPGNSCPSRVKPGDGTWGGQKNAHIVLHPIIRAQGFCPGVQGELESTTTTKKKNDRQDWSFN